MPPALPRVAFLAAVPLYRPILAAVQDAIDGRADTLLTEDDDRVWRWRPEVLVLAGIQRLALMRHLLPGVVIGSIRHGLVRKGVVGMLQRRRTEATARFDFLCIGDEEARATYLAARAAPAEFWETGYPQLDPLFRTPRSVDGRAGNARRLILYAPTWNPGLSSAPLVGDRIARLLDLDGDVHLRIRPHPAIARHNPEWLAPWHTLACREPRVQVIADPAIDVTRLMLDADVLVSDASSVIFEYLALDRPIVLITHPNHTASPAFDQDDITWRWRDLGTEVVDTDDLPAAVAAALAAPAANAPVRRRYADRLFGSYRDGRNAARVADRIVDIAARRASGRYVPIRCDCRRPGCNAPSWHRRAAGAAIRRLHRSLGGARS